MHAKTRIGLLNNLRAGRSDAQVARLLGFLRGHPEVVHVETDSAAVVPEALADLARQEVDLLIVNGGDGTLQRALTEILGNGAFGDRVPLVAPLRGGRTNMTALDLGAHRDPVLGMAGLIEAAEQGRLAERVALRRVLRVAHGFDPQVSYGMFFGAGTVARAIELTHRLFPRGRSQGVFGASLVTAALLGRLAVLGDSRGVLSPDKAQLLMDGEPLGHGEFTLLMACTLDRLFAGLRPFWGRGPGGVRFTGIADGARDLWSSLPGILRGRPGARVTEDAGYLSRNVKCAQLRMDCGFTVDGELVEPDAGRILSVTADDKVGFVRA